MSINFNSLPTQKPAIGTIIPKGTYHAKIKRSEMKTPKKEGRPNYFSAECDITDPESGTPMGKFWINLFESDAALVNYQLSRFITALGLPIQGEFDLKDLTKMVNGKELLVDIQPEENKDGKPPQKSVVDISAECFYPVSVNPAPAPAPVDFPEAQTPAPQAAPTTPAVHASY